MAWYVIQYLRNLCVYDDDDDDDDDNMFYAMLMRE